MRTHSNTIVVLALVLGLASACASRPTLPPGEIVGMEMQPREVVHLSVVDANPEPYWNKTLLIEATVTAVCQHSGCWMQIEDGGSRAMVRWESGCGGDYAFPKDLQGRRVLIQGSIYEKSFSEDEVEHLEEEAGRKLSIEREGREINASAILVVGDPS
jgi:hypothetical protein